MRLAGRVALLVLGGGLVLGGIGPARAADPDHRRPDIVFVPVPILRGEMLRVCVRHVGRSRPVPAADRESSPPTWRVLATDADGGLLFRSDLLRLPAAGQFACQDMARERLAQPGEASTGLLQIAVSLVVDAPGQRACVLSSMQLFDLTAGTPRPVAGGDWQGKGASAFIGDFTSEDLV
jgi:hypothetical protein